jgi:hypothetical protein
MTRALLAALAVTTVLTGCGAGEGRPSTADQPVPTLDPAKVPAELRDLGPLAQAWGIGDDVLRGRRVDGATAAEREELRRAFAPRDRQITAWLDSFGQGLMPDEAAAFMYTQLAIEEMP